MPLPPMRNSTKNRNAFDWLRPLAALGTPGAFARVPVNKPYGLRIRLHSRIYSVALTSMAPPTTTMRWSAGPGITIGQETAQSISNGLNHDGPECREEHVHVVQRRAAAHQADAPDLAGKLAQTGADLDVVLLQQAPSHRPVVRALRHPDGVELRQPILGRDDEPDPHLLQTGAQQFVIPAVALEDGFRRRTLSGTTFPSGAFL